MPTKAPPLRTIQFGRLDASDEATDDPGLLLNGYLDYREAVYKITRGLVWYLLGPKGAGKSAVLEHLKLKWADRPDRFLDSWDLRAFPVADVTQIHTGQMSGPSRTQSAWEFLLLLRVVQSLLRDQSLDAPSEFWSLKAELIRLGLLPDDWKLSVSRWSTSSASFNFKVGFFGVNVANTPVGPLEIAAVLRAALERVSTDNHHVISVDGLDSFFLETDDEWSSLAGLIHAIESVNRFLSKLGLNVTVVAAVRTEAFEALESTDSNKLKSHSVYLDWSPSGAGTESKLWELVNTKVSVDHPEMTDFVETYLKTDIGVGPFNRIPEYFLGYTRLIPRDMIALLTHLQDAHPGSGQVSEQEAVTAVRNYSEQYFVGEIQNNLAGVLADKPTRRSKTNLFFEAIKSVEIAEFSIRDLSLDLDGELSPGEVRQLLKQLFEIGGIGIRTRTAHYERIDFNFRKVSPVAFNPRKTFILHNALIVAWHKPRS
ncbi:MAG TPA: hypothetical protein VHZ81_04620 [Galbitalea sp.]|jgi:hypothetical protein|nr:hypothetical protein [Galbitalea sp.]